jgi:hypothetical protein
VVTGSVVEGRRELLGAHVTFYSPPLLSAIEVQLCDWVDVVGV